MHVHVCMFKQYFLYTPWTKRRRQYKSNQPSIRRMWLHCGILIHLFGFLLAKSSGSFDDAERYSSSLERKLTLKLKTAARLRHNLGKVLHELPVSFAFWEIGRCKANKKLSLREKLEKEASKIAMYFQDKLTEKIYISSIKSWNLMSAFTVLIVFK